MSMIKEINSRTTFSVRHLVLRQGKPIESCQFDGDDNPSTKHFGIFEDEKLIGVVSLFKINNSFFKEIDAYQIRGMAVLDKYQRMGYGEKLVKQCENYVINQKSSLIWFNARENAVRFYEKLGYKTTSNAFEIKDIGIHYIMYKHV
jgi:predicted GNAT family N-acyltransferase